jgi:xylulokinase
VLLGLYAWLNLTDEKFILAFDHGTSGMKTALVSMKGEVKGFTVDEYEMFHFEAGCAEQDPEDWWNALIKTTHSLIDQNKINPENIVAIVTSNQMDGTIPIDKQGNPLHNCISWMDTRGATSIEKHFGGIFGGYKLFKVLNWIGRTGGAPGLSGKDILAHILWLRDEHPEIYKKTWKFLDCKDYINYRLTGKIASSYDCAILTWLVNDRDPSNIFYDEKLLKMTKLPRNKFPDIFPSTHIVGTLLPDVAKKLGLLSSTKVVLGAGDMSSAAVGSGAVLEGQCHICIGSSSWVIAHVSKRKIDTSHFIASLPSAIPGKYYLLGEQESAGLNLQWIRDKVLYNKDLLLKEHAKPDIYKIFDALVEEVDPGADKVIFTPWLFGERAPVEDYTIRGGLFNVSLKTDRRHIIRAIFEGVAFNSRWVMEFQEKILKHPFKSVNLIGGGANSAVWCQIYADILNRPINQTLYRQEANSVGAALIAAVALGHITWDQIPDLIPITKTYQPRAEYRALYDELFAVFVQIYKNHKKLCRKLNKFQKHE